MNVDVHDPLGATVREIGLHDLDDSEVGELRRLLAEHGVVIFPDQHLDDDEFVAALRGFGDLTFTAGEEPLPGHPELNAVTNVGRTTPPRSTFHVDTSYVRHPPAYTALRAVEVPEHGGATLFTNQYRALATLPADLRTHLDGRTITHVVTGLDSDAAAETSAPHPVFRAHPITGRRALYVTTPRRCASISGLAPAEADELIGRLYVHSTRDDNVLRHDWSPGDVVMWDNACVLHRADHADVGGDRVMHRGMVAHSGYHGSGRPHPRIRS